MNLAFDVLLLFFLTSVFGGVASVSRAQEGAEERRPVRKGAPSFTDEDLARYREERLREEGDDSSLAVEAPAPRFEDSAKTVGAGDAPPLGPPGGFSVVLEDLNGTLPAAVREQAEIVARRFVTFFEVPVEGQLLIPLRYFPAAGEYRAYLARNLQDDDVTWTGYYDPGKGEIVVGGGADYVAVLFHEINHFIVDRAFEDAPTWLNEGLAEYFEASSAEGEGLVVKENPHHPRHLAEWMEQGRRPGLRQLLGPAGWTAIDHRREHDRRVRALAWSIVDFLMKDPEGRQTLRAMMARLDQHRGLHSLEALDRTFPGGAAAFERRWLEHVEARVAAR